MNVSIRPLNETDLSELCSFVQEVFDEFVAPHWSQEGIATFHRASPIETQERLADAGYIFLGAKSENALMGVLMISVAGHLYSLFVSGPVRRSAQQAGV